MTGDVTMLRSPALGTRPRTPGLPWAKLQRRTIEVFVSLLAFGVWGVLAYKGGFRVLARLEGVPLGGSWVLDAASLLIGVSGAIAGVSALWAVVMRALGRTPPSLIGAPDDGPADRPRVTGEHRRPGA